MQYFRINVSENCRSHLGVLLFFLNLSIMFIAHATGAMGLFVKQEASSFGNFLVFYNTNSLFKLLFCLSLLFLIFHLIGAKICYDSSFYETRERFHSVLFYWLLAGCALVPLTVAAIIVLTAHQSMVVRGIAMGFRQAMKKYKIDAPMREYINRLQIENQCCGGSSISDWFKVSWVDTSNAAPINRLANSHYMEANGEFLPRWAPFSCCRQDFIGAPCESVSIFFRPKKNEEWIKKSNIYSIDYLSEYDKYSAIFERVEKALKNPPQDVVRRGHAIVQSRRANFDTFLRDVTGHPDAKPPAAPTNQHPSSSGGDRGGGGRGGGGDVDTARAIFEAQGVRAQSFPPELFEHLGKPPWKGRMVWSYDNITTAESDNLDQLLRMDGRDEDSTVDLLRWRSFNQQGCAEPIGRMAQLAMRAAAFLFIYVLVAQILILILTRYLQTSIDTAYRWGNPLLSAPGFLFNTSLPPRPDDYEALAEEGDHILDALAEDLDEDDFKVLLSPSWASGESEDDTVDSSTASTSGVSVSSLDSPDTADSEADGDTASLAIEVTTADADSADGGGDWGISGGTAAASSGTLSRRASGRPVATVLSANRASAMALQSAASVRVRQSANEDLHEEEDGQTEEEGGFHGLKEISSFSQSNHQLKSRASLGNATGKTSSLKMSSGKSVPRMSVSKESSLPKSSQNISTKNKDTSHKTDPKNSSPKKSSPKKSSPRKSSPGKSSPKRSSSPKSSPKKSSPKKSSPKKSSPRSPSPKKSSPKKTSPKKDNPKKASPKKDSSKKSSPKKSSPKKSSPEKSGNKKKSSSPKKSSAKETKKKSKGKTAKKSTKKVKGHKTKRKK